MQLSLTTKVNSALQNTLERATLAKKVVPYIQQSEPVLLLQRVKIDDPSGSACNLLAPSSNGTPTPHMDKPPAWRVARPGLLTSMPGVGPVLACTLIALLPELGGMSRKQVAALIGVAPYAFESGTLKGRRCIWGGRANVRQVLYLSLIHISSPRDLSTSRMPSSA